MGAKYCGGGCISKDHLEEIFAWMCVSLIPGVETL